MERALKAIGEADRVLLVVDSTAPEASDPFALWPEFLDQRPDPAKVTLIRNKADLSGERVALEQCDDGHVTITLSAKGDDTGLQLLRDHLKACMGYEQTAESGFSARRRHLDALRQASEHLEHGRAQLTLAGAGELLAEDLRQAQHALGKLPGRSAPMTCWGAFSPASASASNPQPGKAKRRSLGSGFFASNSLQEITTARSTAHLWARACPRRRQYNR